MTRIIARFALIAIGLIFPAAVSAQNTTPPNASSPTVPVQGVASAKGKVVGVSNEPQAGVPVQIKGPLGKTIATTDKSGTWSLYNLPAGDYRVQMVGSKTPEPVDFTVKEGSFWDKFSGSETKVIWTPDIKLESQQPPS